MRSVTELTRFADRFARENDSAFLACPETEIEPESGVALFGETVSQFGWATRSTAEQETGTEADGEAPADNIGLTKYRTEEFPPGWGGYDGGCEASLLGVWNAGKFGPLLERLEVCRQCADDGETLGAFTDFGGFVWAVRATGAKVGPWKYKYVLESHGLKLYIHSNPRNGIPGVQVRFGFECLCRTNLFDAAATLETCLEREGYHVEEEKISRVDTQILLPVEVSDFLQVMRGKRVVTRCRGTCHMISNMRTGNVETLLLGSENVELCIYDKRAQLLTADAVYYDTFREHILRGEEIPDRLTRVEFRFKRAYLKRYGISTFDDLRNSISALLEIVSSDWFRILSRDKVRGSEKEIEDCALWRRVRSAFRFYFSEHSFTSRDAADLRASTPPRSCPQVDKLVKQALGCLSTAASVVVGKITDVAQITDYCHRVLQDSAQIIQFNTVLKRILLSVKRGYHCGEVSEYPVKSDIFEALPPDGFPTGWVF